MKLVVEFELDDSWDAYIPDNEEKLNTLISENVDTDSVTARIVSADNVD